MPKNIEDVCEPVLQILKELFKGEDPNIVWRVTPGMYGGEDGKPDYDGYQVEFLYRPETGKISRRGIKIVLSDMDRLRSKFEIEIKEFNRQIADNALRD